MTHLRQLKYGSELEPRKSRAVMLSTSAPGGMWSVVETYRDEGVFERWNVVLIVTHVRGSVTARIRVFLSSVLRLTAALMSGKVALVHCHCAAYGSFVRKSILASIARIFGVPVILHLHGGAMQKFYSRLFPLFRRFVSSQLRKASIVLVLTESWREFVETIAPGSKVMVLPNYVPLPLTVMRLRSGPEIQVLFLGLVAEQKGIYELLSAFRLAIADVPQLKLVVAGDGEIEKARAFASGLGLKSKVEFCGWVSGQAKERLFATSEIFVLPSHHEGLPVSILEAMSWRLAVVATNVGGVPDVIRDQVDGLIVSPGDVASLAASLVRLAKDESMRTAMAAAGRSRVERAFSADVVLPKLEGLYASIGSKRVMPQDAG
jgi:glycosyltransferase involved in cell wall biosynthesis